MTSRKHISRASLGTAFAALAIGLGTVVGAAPANAQSLGRATRPAETINVAIGEGTLVNLPGPMSDLFVAKDGVADVQVRSPTQLYIYGKTRGTTTVFATSKAGRVLYSANVNVAYNLSSVEEMLTLAMPDSNIRATPVNSMVLLTGTVASLEDVNEASRLVMAYVGDGIQVVNRVRSAVPLQVTLRVKIAEVSRSLIKEFGVNLLARDGTSGFNFNYSQGQLINPTTGVVSVPTAGSIFKMGGKVLGVDLISAINLAETDGLVTTLAEPNLTALSGETASFLAGGEFPIPVSQSLGSVTVEYKQYGVGLAFTPIVLADGRISMRIRPEVSELSNDGGIKLNGYEVPALTTRRAETTVELGSGQSFMIAGLLRNSNTNNVDKAPFLGDLPVLGALFRSTRYRRAETELVIIVTPYLVRPVSTQLATPVHGYRAPDDGQRVFLGQGYERQPVQPAAPSTAPAPAVAVGGSAAAPGFKL